MAGKGAPIGNQYATKDQRLWADMLRRKCKQDPNQLERIALKVLSAAEAGESWAVTEVANRLDGKPVQAVEVQGEFTQKLLHEYSNAELALIAAGKDLGDAGDNPSGVVN